MKRSMILILVVFAAGAAIAQPMPGGPMPGPMSDLPRGRDPIAMLNLTAEQKAAWDAARKDFRAANEALFDKQRDTEQQLHDALEAKSSDACSIGSLTVSLHAVSDQLEAAHDALKKKLESILTPEQRAKFESMPRPPFGGPPPPPRR